MKSDKKIPLNEYITLQRGFDLPNRDRVVGSVPVVASTGVAGYHNEAKVSAPGVVIGRSGSIGGGQYVQEDFWPLNTTLWVKDFKGHDPRYVYYLLKSIDFSSFNAGAAVPTLNRNHLSNIKVNDLDEIEEKCVSEVLGALDDKIELNRQINQNLEQIAQAIFKSWFVDFEPVKAKIEAKQPLSPALSQRERAVIAERAAMRAIIGKTDVELDQLSSQQRQQLAATAALFPDELVESELGLIPKGWEIQRLENILELSYGKSLTKTDRKDGDYPVYGSGGITGSHDKSLVAGPGIIVGRKGTVGALYWEDRDFFAIDTVFYVEPKNGATLEILFYLLQTLGLKKMNTDAAVPGLNRNNVYRLPVPKYPKKLMEAFTGTIGAIRGKIFCGLGEIKTLDTLRDTLLPKLLSGELTVRTCEQQAEARS